MKLAIIGLGSIGRRHLGNFSAVGVESLTGFDAAPAQREAAAKDFPFATIASSVEAALNGADAAVICTPPDSHVALGRQAAERGAHLMVEKPFAQSVEGVEELLKLCDAKRLKVLTAYNWRYWPPMLLVEKLLKAGAEPNVTGKFRRNEFEGDTALQARVGTRCTPRPSRPAQATHPADSRRTPNRSEGLRTGQQTSLRALKHTTKENPKASAQPLQCSLARRR